jgi:nucleotide-binding universal stress UspA family protein
MASTRKKTAAPIRRILVPLDGSRLGQAAVELLHWVAARPAAEILLLQVVKPVKPAGLVRTREPAAFAQLARSQADAERYLDGIGARLARRGFRVRTLVRSGDPAQEILGCILSQAVDLVVMSTHGRRGLRRAVMGSVAEGVLRKSAVPVLVVRPPRAASADRS